MREYIKIKSKDGKAEKMIEKSQYAQYAQGGWEEVKENKVENKTDYTTSSKPYYGSTATK